jgi:hypothetical protein
MSVGGLLEAAGGLGQRFNLLGLLPGGVLVLLVLLLLWSGAPAQPPDPDEVLARAQDLGAWEGALLFLGLVLAATVTMPLQLGLVRLLEGYWGPLAGERALARQRRRRAALTLMATPSSDNPSPQEEARLTAAAWRLRQRFPPDGLELPTALGNVLRAAEDRAGRRYGLDTVVAWPRLYPLLSPELRAVLDDQRDQLDISARLCAVFAACAAITLVLTAPHGGWWLLVVPGWIGLAWLSYRGAVAAAVAYGSGLEAAFDLHRFDLLRALHLPLPHTRSAEREANRELSQFLRGQKPVPFEYAHPDAPAADEEAVAQ